MKGTGSNKNTRELIIFFTATVAVTWIIWLPALLIQNYGVRIGVPYNIIITIGTFVPSLAGFLFAYMFGGKGEVISLLKSHINARIKIKWLLFALLVLPAVSGVHR